MAQVPGVLVGEAATCPAVRKRAYLARRLAVAARAARRRDPGGRRPGAGRRSSYGPALFQATEKLVPSVDTLEGAALVAVPALFTIVIDVSVLNEPIVPVVVPMVA